MKRYLRLLVATAAAALTLSVAAPAIASPPAPAAPAASSSSSTLLKGVPFSYKLEQHGTLGYVVVNPFPNNVPVKGFTIVARLDDTQLVDTAAFSYNGGVVPTVVQPANLPGKKFDPSTVYSMPGQYSSVQKVNAQGIWAIYTTFVTVGTRSDPPALPTYGNLGDVYPIDVDPTSPTVCDLVAATAYSPSNDPITLKRVIGFTDSDGNIVGTGVVVTRSGVHVLKFTPTATLYDGELILAREYVANSAGKTTNAMIYLTAHAGGNGSPNV